MKLFARRSVLLLAVSPLSLIASTASAQSADPSETLSSGATTPAASGASQAAQEIVVTGTRASLQNAERIKRDADVIIDGISADDIAALPDSSLADSLVRVTGITANDGPRGPDAVSIRGLGPDFTITTLNGRVVASPNGGNRRISLGELPTEGISGAFVQKTTDARTIAGGVAGVLDLRSIHPLDTHRRGLTIVGRAIRQDISASLRKARHFAPLSGRGEVTYVNRFGAGDDFGVAVSYAVLKKYTAFEGVQIDNWRLGKGPREDVNGDGVPDALPTNVGPTVNFNDDTRHSVLSMLQWDIDPAVRLSVDGHFISDLLYSGPVRFFANNIYAAALGPVESAHVNDFDTVDQFSGQAALYRGVFNENRQLDDTVGGGITLDVDKGPITAKLDLSIDRAVRHRFAPTAVVENDADGAPGARQPFGFDIADVHDIQLDFADLAAEDYALQRYADTAQTIHDTIKAFRGDFAYHPAEGSFIKSIDAGFRVAMRDHHYAIDRTTYTWKGRPVRPDLDSSYLELGDNPFAPQADNLGGETATSFPYFDIRQLAALKDAPGVIVDDQFANDLTDSFSVKENTAALYGQVDFHSGGFGGNIGARYVITDRVVHGNSGTTTDNVTPQAFPNTYEYFLPALNLRYDITDTLIARFAASKTVAPQQFNDLKVGTAIDLTTVPTDVITINRGNPNLRPFTAKSLDLDFEWYPGTSTSIAVAGYIKYVTNFLETETQNTTITLADGTEADAIINTRVNDPKTQNLKGVEVTVRRDFDFLPGQLGNLGIQGNFTHNWTNIRDNFASLVGETADVQPNLFTGNVFNAQLYYSGRKLDLRLAYRNYDRYTRDFFNAYQEQPGGNFDFNARWTVFKKFRVIASVRNIFKKHIFRYTPDYRYPDNKSLTRLSVYNGREFSIGFRANF